MHGLVEGTLFTTSHHTCIRTQWSRYGSLTSSNQNHRPPRLFFNFYIQINSRVWSCFLVEHYHIFFRATWIRRRWLELEIWLVKNHPCNKWLRAATERSFAIGISHIAWKRLHPNENSSNWRSLISGFWIWVMDTTEWHKRWFLLLMMRQNKKGTSWWLRHNKDRINL